MARLARFLSMNVLGTGGTRTARFTRPTAGARVGSTCRTWPPARTLAQMQPFLIAIRTRGRVGRLAVWAASGADALAKARVAVPMAPPDAFHVQRKGGGDVLLLPTRCCAPNHVRMHSAEHQEFLRTLPDWSEIT
jgi:hypothetical protein